MDSFFRPDNPFSRFMTQVFRLIILNVVFIVTSLPVFTIGAGLTGLYAALLWREDDDGHTLGIYFSSFKKNFRQATLVWVPALALGAFFSWELYLVFHVLDPSFKLLQIPVWLMLFFVVSVLLYAFPLIARYEEKTGQLLKNCVLISVGNIPVTILFLVILFLLLDFGLHNGTVMVVLFSIFLFMGFSLLILIFSFYLKRWVFPKLEKKEQK